MDWYAARIMRIMPLLDKEKTTYFTMTTGEKYVGIPKYREDIEEPFFIARDEEHTVLWVVSELFKDLCDRNGLQIEYSEAGVFSCETAHQSGTDCNLPDGLVKMSDPKCSHVSMELKEKILEFAKLLMNEKIIVLDNFEKFSKQNYEDIVLGIKQQLHDTYPKTKLKKQMKSVHYANGFSDENLKQSAFILDDIEQYLSINGFMDYDTSVRYYNETITTDGFEINPQSLVMTMIDSLLVCVHGDKNMQ